MPQLSIPVPNVMPPLLAACGPIHLSMGHACGQGRTTRFAARELCGNGISGSFDSTEVSRRQEIPDPNVIRRAGDFDFAHFLFARTGAVVLVPDAPVMVKFNEVRTLVYGLAGATAPENICGMPVKDVIEKLSDEGTLPSLRPRSFP